MMLKDGHGYVCHLTLGYAAAPTTAADEFDNQEVLELQLAVRRVFDMRPVTAQEFSVPVVQAH